MNLVIGVVLFIAAVAVVWRFKTPDGVHPHPFVNTPAMGMAFPLVVVCLAMAGIGFIVEWALT